MAQKLLGVLIDVKNETAEAVEIEDTLDELYRILNCDCIDITARRIGVHSKKYFDIVCDDEGTFKDPQKISAIDDFGRPMLVGNIFIVNAPAPDDENGNLRSLEKSEVDYILGKIQKMYTNNFPKGYKMLTQCEY